jgi:hypothetical protein
MSAESCRATARAPVTVYGRCIHYARSVWLLSHAIGCATAANLQIGLCQAAVACFQLQRMLQLLYMVSTFLLCMFCGWHMPCTGWNSCSCLLQHTQV